MLHIWNEFLSKITWLKMVLEKEETYQNSIKQGSIKEKWVHDAYYAVVIYIL